jgi:molybdopterin-guanine dinucleotide biosynthesis protein B
MKLLAVCGASGAGKTTLIEGLVGVLRQRAQRVSVIKHAQRGFEIDRAGSDSDRLGKAGAFEVLLASSQRVVKLREFETTAIPTVPTVHQLVAELHDCGWVLAEGFKHADVMKIEVWRAALDAPALYADDPFIHGIATDTPADLPMATLRPVFALDDAATVADHLLRDAHRFEYAVEHHV